MKPIITMTTVLSGVLAFAASADVSSIDTDNNGELSQAEIEAEMAADFAEQDSDADGSVSAEEFLNAAGVEVTDSSLEQATRVLNSIDGDDDGQIQFEDVEDRVEQTASIREEIDSDGDGEVSDTERDEARNEVEALRDEARDDVEREVDAARDEAETQRDEAERDVDKARDEAEARRDEVEQDVKDALDDVRDNIAPD
jgi:ElaB/YqjD/DUF883 family membrane-anchored ribosome-binding protein